ncbi:MarR family winged helix-turn-helix transcriptional regulator [Dyadobacter frigoris]|uniref:MarR family transcriptional regulator n=1 Tax=Dyadobacter frigoris TaxID=2576211 RepID=A0A4V6BH49_9BACT|nr:MarR family transcriptional regulator [Dyadobacter frigoris]TKT84733.1 MarR family transcriptional regulator [Dyadobacter frigoris]GLU57416.1 hypothetical protein Dfri01_68770 [Dyadobacter frigoris]
MSLEKKIVQIRSFNRFYTDVLGLVNNNLLDSEYSLAEARILYEIFTARTVSASDIISKLSMDKGYLSRILKKFERSGLIIRKASKEDARVYLLSLTDQGKSVFDTLNHASYQQISRLVSNMAEQQLDELVKYMHEITRLLQKANKHITGSH